MAIQMWFVETARGTMDPFYNYEAAQAEAKKRGTRIWDTETKQYYNADGSEA